MFAAIIYVLVSGCDWRALPPCFGTSKSTAHHRFLIWSRAGAWGRLHKSCVQHMLLGVVGGYARDDSPASCETATRMTKHRLTTGGRTADTPCR